MRILVLAFTAMALTACTSGNEFGPCVGLADTKNPQLEYKVSARNLFFGIVGIEMILPPILVAVNETYCPIGPKQ